MRSRFSPALLLAASLLATGAQADTVKVLTSGAFKQIVLALVPGFEARTGHTVVVSNDTAGALAKRIAEGEAFDLVVLTPAALKALAVDGPQGKVVADTVKPLASVGIGVAVKAGAARPDISDVEHFRQALLQAKKVAYIDPAAGGSSGIYLEALFQKMGVADAVHAKAVLVKGGFVAEKLVTGEVDLAVHQISEILPVTGAELVGPIPEAVQNYTTYAGAVGRGSEHPEAAQAFLDSLSGEAAAAVLQQKGMLPAR